MCISLHVSGNTSQSLNKQTDNEIIQFISTWMNLEGIMLSELIRTDKDKYHMRQVMCGI